MLQFSARPVSLRILLGWAVPASVILSSAKEP